MPNKNRAWRNETDLSKAKIAVLAFIRAHESLRRNDGSLLHDPTDWRTGGTARSDVVVALNAVSIFAYRGFIEQKPEQTIDQINEMQEGKLNPYPTDKSLTRAALDALVEEGFLEAQILGNAAKYRLTEKGKKFELPSVELNAPETKKLAFSPKAAFSSDTVQNTLLTVLGPDDPRVKEIMGLLSGDEQGKERQ